MIVANKVGVFAITFTVACAVLYTIATEINLPLVTYYPVIGQVDALWKPARSGPAMYWYGWMLTSLIGATIFAFFAIIVPESWLQRAILLGSLGAVAYLVVYSLSLLIYDKATVEMEFLKSRWLSVAVAAVIAVIAGHFAPRAWNQRVWPGWVLVVPIGALAVLGYYLMPYFTR